jgi:hypothetical protein
MKIHKSQIPKGTLLNAAPDKGGWFDGEYHFSDGGEMATFANENGIVFRTSKPAITLMTALGFRAFVLFEGPIKKGEQTFIAASAWFSFKGDEK